MRKRSIKKTDTQQSVTFKKAWVKIRSKQKTRFGSFYTIKKVQIL